jgi:U3 small nucleolar RNA-associated protein 22
LLSLPSGIIDNYGTGEEKLSDTVNTFNELVKLLKNLKDLPLAINNVHGISSVFRVTDVFAPMPCCFNYDLSDEKNMCYKTNNKLIPKYPLGSVLAPYIKPLKIIGQLEASGKWPDDLECIQRLKAAFYLKIAQSLRENHGLLAFANSSYCDMLYKGFVFRLSVCTMNELLCMKSSVNEQGVVISNETKETLAYEKNMTYIPKLTNFIFGFDFETLL